MELFIRIFIHYYYYYFFVVGCFEKNISFDKKQTSLYLEDLSWEFYSCMWNCMEKLSISIRDKRVSYVKTVHTITPFLRTVYHSKTKIGLRCSQRGFATNTSLSSLPKLNLDSLLRTVWLHLVAFSILFLSNRCPGSYVPGPSGLMNLNAWKPKKNRSE